MRSSPGPGQDSGDVITAGDINANTTSVGLPTSLHRGSPAAGASESWPDRSAQSTVSAFRSAGFRPSDAEVCTGSCRSCPAVREGRGTRARRFHCCSAKIGSVRLLAMVTSCGAIRLARHLRIAPCMSELSIISSGIWISSDRRPPGPGVEYVARRHPLTLVMKTTATDTNGFARSTGAARCPTCAEILGNRKPVPDLPGSAPGRAARAAPSLQARKSVPVFVAFRAIVAWA